MMLKKSDDAVSPVIGIMLMLVVTIVIAAVVAAVATGMVGEGTEPAPTAKLDVEIYSAYKGSTPTMFMTHVSGDPLDTADLRLSFSWKCAKGTCDICRDNGGYHSSTYSYDDNPDGYLENGKPFGIGGVVKPVDYDGASLQPLYVNYGSMKGWYFGQSIWSRGETLHAFTLHLTGDLEESGGNPAMDILFNNGDVLIEEETNDQFKCQCSIECYNSYDGVFVHSPGECTGQYSNDYGDGYLWCNNIGCSSGIDKPADYDSSSSSGSSEPSKGIMECLTSGTAVDVKVIHIPSNKPIYSETVYVQ